MDRLWISYGWAMYRLRIGYGLVTDGLETGLWTTCRGPAGIYPREVRGLVRMVFLIFYRSFLAAIGFGLYWLAESNAG
jgi:hypothetical protein